MYSGATRVHNPQSSNQMSDPFFPSSSNINLPSVGAFSDCFVSEEVPYQPLVATPTEHAPSHVNSSRRFSYSKATSEGKVDSPQIAHRFVSDVHDNPPSTPSQEPPTELQQPSTPSQESPIPSQELPISSQNPPTPPQDQVIPSQGSHTPSQQPPTPIQEPLRPSHDPHTPSPDPPIESKGSLLASGVTTGDSDNTSNLISPMFSTKKSDLQQFWADAFSQGDTNGAGSYLFSLDPSPVPTVSPTPTFPQAFSQGDEDMSTQPTTQPNQAEILSDPMSIQSETAAAQFIGTDEELTPNETNYVLRKIPSPVLDWTVPVNVEATPTGTPTNPSTNDRSATLSPISEASQELTSSLSQPSCGTLPHTITSSHITQECSVSPISSEPTSTIQSQSTNEIPATDHVTLSSGSLDNCTPTQVGDDTPTPSPQTTPPISRSTPTSRPTTPQAGSQATPTLPQDMRRTPSPQITPLTQTQSSPILQEPQPTKQATPTSQKATPNSKQASQCSKQTPPTTYSVASLPRRKRESEHRPLSPLATTTHRSMELLDRVGIYPEQVGEANKFRGHRGHQRYSQRRQSEGPRRGELEMMNLAISGMDHSHPHTSHTPTPSQRALQHSQRVRTVQRSRPQSVNEQRAHCQRNDVASMASSRRGPSPPQVTADSYDYLPPYSPPSHVTQASCTTHSPPTHNTQSSSTGHERHTNEPIALLADPPPSYEEIFSQQTKRHGDRPRSSRRSHSARESADPAVSGHVGRGRRLISLANLFRRSRSRSSGQVLSSQSNSTPSQNTPSSQATQVTPTNDDFTADWVASYSRTPRPLTAIATRQDTSMASLPIPYRRPPPFNSTGNLATSDHGSNQSLNTTTTRIQIRPRDRHRSNDMTSHMTRQRPSSAFIATDISTVRASSPIFRTRNLGNSGEISTSCTAIPESHTPPTPPHTLTGSQSHIHAPRISREGGGSRTSIHQSNLSININANNMHAVARVNEGVVHTPSNERVRSEDSVRCEDSVRSEDGVRREDSGRCEGSMRSEDTRAAMRARAEIRRLTQLQQNSISSDEDGR